MFERQRVARYESDVIVDYAAADEIALLLIITLRRYGR